MALRLEEVRRDISELLMVVRLEPWALEIRGKNVIFGKSATPISQKLTVGSCDLPV
jgi:hypothetical protein